MNANLIVKSDIERSNGKAGGIGNERFEVRFWLTTEVNGRYVASRGTVVNIEKPTIEEARKWMQQITYTLNSKILNNQWSSADAKQANAELPKLVNDAIAEDAQFHIDFGV